MIRVFQVGGRVDAPAQDVVRRARELGHRGWAGTRDADHLGAEVGENHSGVRNRAEAREFDDANAV